MESNFVQAGEVKLQYYQHGHGSETLVLVHGNISSSRMWHLTMEQVDPARFRVIALNNRGAGDSDRSPSEDAYTVESFAKDLHNVAEALSPESFTLAGHSLGGATVAQYALDHPSRLKGLVLLNSVPLDGMPLAGGWDQAIREQFTTGTLPEGDMGFDASHLTDEFKQAVWGDIARNPVERSLGSRRSMSQIRLRERLKEISVPTLVIGSDRDDTVGVHNILADYLALPEQSRHLHIFHGIGHSPNVEIPQRLAGLLTRFMEEVSEADPVRATAG